eukprot:TRINITY_DN4277_c0_g1_i3.p1 TRINITY_DN4277_c0_g1~~TRINITY_DN4277_c0_g1_i3.p1  ORF type:complete len:204 (-),score=54.91 TRINITY_DN4277_c0_g1_i3:516-1127(-)
MERANVEWMKQATGYEWRPRKDINLLLDEKYFKDGDFIAITRMDGLDQIIEYATGGHAGHCALTMWIDGQLFVLESQHAWYWPKINIQRTPYREWLKNAWNAGYHVVHVPLTEDARSRLNTDAAMQWFEKVEGMPYGFHNFLFGALDTKKDNLPPLLDENLVAVGFGVVEKIIPSAIDSLWNEAMNKRLGTKVILPKIFFQKA